MTPRSTSAGPFHRRARSQPTYHSADFLRRESMILKARAAGSGEWDRSVVTSEEKERVEFRA
jgi:hypothetical protein